MKNKIVAVLTGVSLMFSSVVRADPLSLSGTSTSLVVTGGVIWLVWWLIDSNAKKNRSADEDAGKREPKSVQVERQELKAKEAAAFFLKDNSVSLTKELAVGEGPVLDMLAASLNVPSEHRARMGQLLQAHHVELTDLARADLMTPDRAGQFVQRFVEITTADSLLAAHLQTVQAPNSLN